MEKSTSKSIYCDYNSTSPLSNSVVQFLGNGDFIFANPSSVHQLGKNSKKVIREVTDYIHNLYNFSSNEHQCIFHSGATEGINTIVLGLLFKKVVEKRETFTLFYSSLDHSCVLNLLTFVKRLGGSTQQLPVEQSGALKLDESIELINNCDSDNKLLSFTWVNNEIGLVQPLELACEIKIKTNCQVFVDAVQSPGKIAEWRKLDKSLDAYIFSAHKFGALKGVGFSFVSNELDVSPTLYGGGQQKGYRPGTENITGIQSIKFAFEDLVELTSKKDYDENKRKCLNEIEKHLYSMIKNNRNMVSQQLSSRSNNTICFVSEKIKANILMISMDMAGLQVSSGSACSSGASLPSRILLKLGFSNEEAQGGIRMSFPPDLDQEMVREVKKRLTLSVGKYYHI